MFELLFEKASQFKKLFDAVNDLVKNVNFHCDNNQGLHLQAMDASRVSLISLLLSKNSFKKFMCDKPHKFGVNLQSLSKIFKITHPNDSVCLNMNDEQDDILHISFEDIDAKRVLKFELKLLVIEEVEVEIPDVEYPCTIRMCSRELKTLANDLYSISDTVSIACSTTEVSFSCAADIGEGSVTFKNKEHSDGLQNGVLQQRMQSADVLLRCTKSSESVYALKYLNFFAKATLLTDTVTIFLAENQPLVVQYELKNTGYLKYYLAPKIEDDI